MVQMLRPAKNLLILAFLMLPAFSAALAQQADNTTGTTAGGPAARKNKPKRAVAPSGGDSFMIQCASSMPRELFTVDSSGSVSNTGRTYEGPLCIEVFHNPIQQFVGLQ